jgi:hypothetical protein
VLRSVLSAAKEASKHCEALQSRWPNRCRKTSWKSSHAPRERNFLGRRNNLISGLGRSVKPWNFKARVGVGLSHTDPEPAADCLSARRRPHLTKASLPALILSRLGKQVQQSRGSTLDSTGLLSIEASSVLAARLVTGILRYTLSVLNLDKLIL